MAELPPLAEPSTLAALTGMAEDDPALVAALGAASARFRAAVRHPVSRVADDEARLDGTGTRVLLLPAVPVESISTVDVDGGAAVTDYTWSANGTLLRDTAWPDRLGAVRVVYTHGWATVPADVADAVLDEARHLLAAQPGLASMTVGGESVAFTSSANDMPRAWRQAVANYAINRGDRP